MADEALKLEARSYGAALKLIMAIIATIAISGGSWVVYTTMSHGSQLDVIKMEETTFVKREELGGMQQSIVGLERDVKHIQEEQSKMYVTQQQMLNLQTDSLRQQDKTQAMIEEIRRNQPRDASPNKGN